MKSEISINGLPFINDEKVIGKWEFFDVISYNDEFDSEKSSTFSDKGLKEIYFLPNGEKYWIFEGWTKGKLFTHYGGNEPLICNEYEIVEKNGELYLFLTVNADSEPYINVLKKVDSKEYSLMEIGNRDDVNLPFVLDNKVLGCWKAIDFIRDKGDFNPKADNFDDLWLKSILFKADGTVIRTYSDEEWNDRWTAGCLIDDNKKVLSHYEIKSVEGKKYLILEWKMGNYVYGGASPDYYVFVKETN